MSSYTDRVRDPEQKKNIEESMKMIRENNYKWNPNPLTADDLFNMNQLKNLNKYSHHQPTNYSYTINLRVTLNNGSVLDLSKFIYKMRIEVDFNKAVFPMFRLLLKMERENIPILHIEDEAEYFIECYGVNINEATGLYNKLFESNLIAIKKDENPINLERDNYNQKDTMSTDMALEYYELELIPKECLAANKTLFQGAYTNTDLTTLISYMTSKLDIPVSIEPLSNRKVYKQIITLPYNIFFNLEYLDNFYGLYESGLKMFYGFDLFKIQSNSYYRRDLGENIVKVQFDKSKDRTEPEDFIQSGISKLGKDNLITSAFRHVHVIDNEKAIRETVGTRIKFSKRDDEKRLLRDNSYEVHEEPVNKHRYYLNTYSNRMKELELYNLANNTKQVSLSLINVFLMPSEWFKPFSFKFESTIYGENMSGTYLPTALYFQFDNSGLGYYNENGNIQLRRVNR